MTPVSFRFAPGFRLAVSDGKASIAASGGGEIPLGEPGDGRLAVLRALGEGATEAELLAAVGAPSDLEGQAWVHYTLERLVSLGLVGRTFGEPPIVAVDSIGRGYRPSARPLPEGQPVVLSRFAYLRAEHGACVLESPCALSRISFPDWRGPALLTVAAAGADIEHLQLPPGLDAEDARLLLTVLFQEGFLEPESPELDEWEFHDLLFHARSREGRHRNPYGGAYAFAGVREPLPAVKAPPEGEQIPLYRPDISALRTTDPPFAEVLEERRSWRVPGPEPLTANQLGELLYRTARVRGRRGTEHEEVSNRPYPGGGADYELELYPLVHRVAGLEQGLYHYDPLGHALSRVRGWDAEVEAVARGAARKAPPGELPDVLLAVTARFGRLTYKYRSICYAIALKDVGVLYQTLYLAATCMGLSPCALGGGDSDAFAAVSGLSALAEPQVGELMLNSRNPNEVAASGIALPAEPGLDS